MFCFLLVPGYRSPPSRSLRAKRIAYASMALLHTKSVGNGQEQRSHTASLEERVCEVRAWPIGGRIGSVDWWSNRQSVRAKWGGGRAGRNTSVRQP
eukprot:2754791-Rhodomonas_salina.2